MENMSVAGGWDPGGGASHGLTLGRKPGERRGEWPGWCEGWHEAGGELRGDQRWPGASGHWGMVPSLKLGPGPVKWRVPPLLAPGAHWQWYTIRQTDSRRSRPSTVQRATSSLITSPLKSPTSSDQVPNSLGQYQPRQPASWRPPRTSTPPASTSQRLTGRVLERTKTSQVWYLLFKAAQLTTTANHHHHDEPRSHRSVLKLLPLPLLSPFISLIMSPVIMSQMPCSQLSVF